jgi:flagella synthesis protein FlgN
MGQLPMNLADLLGQACDDLDTLTTLLEEERQALALGAIDGERLQRIAADKQSLIESLERTEAARRNAQAAGGYPEGDLGARRAAEDADCLDAWLAMRSASERAARLNELAGAMVATRMKQNQRILDLIHAVSEKTLYDTRGRKGSQPGHVNASA